MVQGRHLSREKALHPSFPKHHTRTVGENGCDRGSPALQTSPAGCWRRPLVPSFMGSSGHPGPVGK